MKQLFELSSESPKKSFKGEIVLKLKVDVKDGVAEVSLDVTTKVPKRPRRSELFWIDKLTGFLSTDHPRQIQMFPREVEPTVKVIDGSAVTETAAPG